MAVKWLPTPSVKIYESIGAIADGRVEIAGNTAKVYSSSRAKYYDVAYDPDSRSIMSNDNGSFWKGYLGYPGIAFLMVKGMVSYDPALGDLLKGIAWKDINLKFKNDFSAALEFILASKTEDHRDKLRAFVEKVSQEVVVLDLNMLGEKQRPPAGY